MQELIGNDVSRAYPWPGEGGRGARAVECTRSATTAFNVIVDYIISNRRRQAIRAAHACAHVRKKALAERPILYASESRSRRAGIASSFLLPTNARSSSPFFPFEDRGVARRVFRSDADATNTQTIQPFQILYRESNFFSFFALIVDRTNLSKS